MKTSLEANNADDIILAVSRKK